MLERIVITATDKGWEIERQVHNGKDWVTIPKSWYETDNENLVIGSVQEFVDKNVSR